MVNWNDDDEPFTNRRTPGLQEARTAICASQAGGIVVAEIA